MIALVALVAIVAAIAYVATHASRATTGAPSSGAGSRPEARRPDRSLDDDLERWTGAGLITMAEADAIRAHERRREAAPQPEVAKRAGRIPPAAEALGYLGGLLGVIGLVLLVAQYWSDMATAGRLGLSGAGAVALLVAGAIVPATADPALARLRAFLWVASAAATAVFAGVAMADAFGRDRDVEIAIACSGAVAVHSGLLWRWRTDRPAQQLVALGAVVVFGATLVAQWADTSAGGLTAWVIAATMLTAGMLRRTPNCLVTDAVGAVGMAFGALLTVEDWRGFGFVFAALTAIVLVAVALHPRLAPTTAEQRIVGLVGGVASLQAVPSAITYFAQDAGAVTGAVTWAVGAGLVLVGARRLVRMPVIVEAIGAAALIGGAALTGAQWADFAPIFGFATAVGLVALGTLPGRALLSVFGSLGLLVNVPWAIARFFPGDGRAPLLIMVSGALIVAIAVLLARMSGRLRRELVR